MCSLEMWLACMVGFTGPVSIKFMVMECRLGESNLVCFSCHAFVVCLLFVFQASGEFCASD